MRKELIMIILISGIAAGLLLLLLFGIGYSLGRKRALIDPQHDYVTAAFYLVVLKELDEKRYDVARDGIAMMARNHVRSCRDHEKYLSHKKLSEIKKRISGSELIDNAEQLCGSLA
jgi:hypothetical protein